LEEHKYEPQPTDWYTWHEFSFEWTPDYIAWFVDGKEQRREHASSSEGVRLMTKAQTLYMNYWTANFSPWGDHLDDSKMPYYV